MIDSDKGSKARSLEGHAAVSMKRTGPDDLRWVEIQTTTFKNWVNEQLPDELDIVDMETDFADGTKLIALVEALQSKLIRRVRSRNPQNQHQCLENLTIALDAIQRDKIKLVNIGAEDIAENNSKLILGLIWHLILRYQIGKTSYNPKNMMLIWLQNALPKCNIKNFSTSWNDGVALHALVDFCRPGSCPNWEELDPNNRLENCRNAMNMGKEKFDIPLVVRPEDLASPHLDELSGMTYLSYYMKEHSPGYETTLNRVRRSLTKTDVTNFTTDWNDGQAVCELVEAAGGDVTHSSGTHEEVLAKGLNASKLIGIQPTLTAKQMAEEKEEHLGIMAYAVKFLGLVPESHNMSLTASLDNVHAGQKTQCSLELLNPSVKPCDVDIEVIGPDSKIPVYTDWKGRMAEIEFQPVEKGTHQLQVSHKGNIVGDCSKGFDVNSNMSNISYTEIDCCPNETLTEIKVKAHSARSGQIKVLSKSPSGKEYRPEMITRDGLHTAEFIPNEVGKWNISILHEDKHIASSPFPVDVFDPSKVKIVGLEGGTLGKELSFKADCKEAGEGNFSCVIYHEGQQIPIKVNPIEEDLTEVKFLPQGAGIYKIHGQFNNVDIKGSPYTLEIVDSDMVSVSGAGLELIPVNQVASFNIFTKDAGGGEVKVNITSPSNTKVPISLKNPESGVHVAKFTPKHVGDYVVHVTDEKGFDVRGSPFFFKAYDNQKVIVSNMPKEGSPGELIEFTIDASKAGDGNLNITVNGKRDNCNMKNLGSQRFSAHLKPVDNTPQVIEMSFNHEKVEGSPWIVNMVSASSFALQEPMSKLIHIKEPVQCAVTGPDTHMSEIVVKVYDNKNNEIPNKIKKKSGKCCEIDFVPTAVGTHKVTATFKEKHILDSPQIIKVYDPSGIEVSDIPTEAVVGKKKKFTLDVSKSGDGRLKIKLNKGELENTVSEISSNFYGVSFVPQKPGPLEIDLTFNDRPIKDSPYMCCVKEKSKHVEVIDLAKKVSCNTLSTFKIHLKNKSDPDEKIEVKATSPNGSLVPTKLVPESNGDYTVEWFPVIGGHHSIDVLYDNKKVHNSPFTVEALDVTSVTITDTFSTIINKPAGMTVDTYGAGKASNVITVLDPTGKSVPFKTKEKDTKKEIVYIPKVAGEYQIYVNFGGLELPGSPITQKVGDGITPRVHGDGLYKGFKDEPTIFTVDSAHMRGDLFVQVDGPKSIAKCDINPEEDGAYTVTYIPVEVGQYNVNVKWDGQLIQDCPFHPKIFDIQKVHVVGGRQAFMDSNNRIPLILNEKKKISFDVEEAGPGKLSAVVTDPHQNNVPVHIESHSPGINTLSFTPKVNGNYYINICWADRQLVGAPFIGSVASKGGQKFDSALVVLSGPGVRKAVVGQEAEFHLDGSKAPPGQPEVNVTGVRTDIPTQLISQGNQCYQCKYTPVIPGAYHLNIKWSGKQLMGCPYKITAIAAPLPRNVTVTGDGLKGGMLGKELHMDIDTRKAGLGVLTAQCVGPHKNAYCELLDNHQGVYRLTVQPQETGRHVLQIKFAGEDVLGSPYVLNIGTYPDASKVRVSGPGVEHGILATYESRFLVETKGAGAGQLSVRIKGPKGAFHVEMSRDSQKDRNITCCYNPYETGVYLIQVKWSGVDVPGSPFEVHIVDTHHEYEAIVKDTANHSNGYLDSPKQRHSAYDYLR